jgi:hypothetical protein
MVNSARKDEIAKRIIDVIDGLPQDYKSSWQERALPLICQLLTSYEEERTPPPLDFHRGMSLAELAEAQGVKPISDVRELAGDIIPEGEDVDAFLASTRESPCQCGQFAIPVDAAKVEGRNFSTHTRAKCHWGDRTPSGEGSTTLTAECLALDPGTRQWVCTRPLGHAGEHVATVDVVRWVTIGKDATPPASGNQR